MCSNLLVLFVGADWLAAVSGDAIFNYHCKWPRTCVSEAFPPCAVTWEYMELIGAWELLLGGVVELQVAG